jgi:hypothetical protein
MVVYIPVRGFVWCLCLPSFVSQEVSVSLGVYLLKVLSSQNDSMKVSDITNLRETI